MVWRNTPASVVLILLLDALMYRLGVVVAVPDQTLFAIDTESTG